MKKNLNSTYHTSRSFSSCSKFVDLKVNQKNCRYDSCRNGPCPSLEQAAEECKKAGFCINWRNLTGETCGEPLILSPDVSWMFLSCVSWTVSILFLGVTCPKGLVYDECRDRLDDFCSGGSVTSAHVVLAIFVSRYLVIFSFLVLAEDSFILDPPWTARPQAVSVQAASSERETIHTPVFLSAHVSPTTSACFGIKKNVSNRQRQCFYFLNLSF